MTGEGLSACFRDEPHVKRENRPACPAWAYLATQAGHGVCGGPSILRLPHDAFPSVWVPRVLPEGLSSGHLAFGALLGDLFLAGWKDSQASIQRQIRNKLEGIKCQKNFAILLHQSSQIKITSPANP